MDKFLCLLFLCLTAPFSALKQCQFGQYWSKVLQVCRPCRDVCEPPARPSCWDFCLDVFFQRQSNSTTVVTKIMSTTSQPIIADYTFLNVLSPILVAPLLMVGSVVGMFFVVDYFRNTKVRNAHRCRRDVENGNGQQGIELQPLNGTAVQQENDNQDVDENGDGNRDGDASGTWVYEPEYDCPRIRDMETLPQQRAQPLDSLDSLPQQRAQQPDSLDNLPQQRAQQPDSLDSLPQQRAQQPDSLDSLPQQRAQQPDSLDSLPQQRAQQLDSLDSLPQQRAQQPDSLDSLPQQRAQPLDSLERNHNSY